MHCHSTCTAVYAWRSPPPGLEPPPGFNSVTHPFRTPPLSFQLCSSVTFARSSRTRCATCHSTRLPGSHARSPFRPFSTCGWIVLPLLAVCSYLYRTFPAAPGWFCGLHPTPHHTEPFHLHASWLAFATPPATPSTTHCGTGVWCRFHLPRRCVSYPTNRSLRWLTTSSRCLGRLRTYWTGRFAFAHAAPHTRLVWFYTPNRRCWLRLDAFLPSTRYRTTPLPDFPLNTAGPVVTDFPHPHHHHQLLPGLVYFLWASAGWAAAPWYSGCNADTGDCLRTRRHLPVNPQIFFPRFHEHRFFFIQTWTWWPPPATTGQHFLRCGGQTLWWVS